MSDLISRQAAIDKLKREEKIFYSPTGLRYLIGAIRDLPSAQPEVLAHGEGELSAQHEPIRLRLDHELSKEEYERLKKDCAEQPIILLPKESAQQWIPCREGLPEESGDYLVTVAHHSGELLVEVDQFDNENGSWWHYMDDVIAWMPLPEPYKGEES